MCECVCVTSDLRVLSSSGRCTDYALNYFHYMGFGPRKRSVRYLRCIAAHPKRFFLLFSYACVDIRSRRRDCTRHAAAGLGLFRGMRARVSCAYVSCHTSDVMLCDALRRTRTENGRWEKPTGGNFSARTLRVTECFLSSVRFWGAKCKIALHTHIHTHVFYTAVLCQLIVEANVIYNSETRGQVR